MSQPNRIDQRFASLRSEGKAAFVAYICAGDPTMEKSLEVMFALERAGADIIELGVPFSDPMADGIVNQMASHRALEAGGSLPGVLELIREISRRFGDSNRAVHLSQSDLHLRIRALSRRCCRRGGRWSPPPRSSA
ncbi:MAG: tryptophan synthase subunit alpha [Verrucomicrobiota bacterium]